MTKDEIIAAIRTRAFDPEIAVAQAKAESDFDPNAVGPMTRYGRAKGLFQFIDSTWQQYGQGSVFDPLAAIDARNAFMRDLYAQFGGDPQKALAAYNWGPGNLRSAIRRFGSDWLSHAPTETQNYVSRILRWANFPQPPAKPQPGADRKPTKISTRKS